MITYQGVKQVSVSNFSPTLIRDRLQDACEGLKGSLDPDRVANEVISNLYAGASDREVHQAMILAVRSYIEREPAYEFVAARLLLNTLYSEAVGEPVTFRQADEVYDACFDAYFDVGIRAERLNPELRSFDLDVIKRGLHPERDLAFRYAGLQTLYDRYLLHENGRRFELPQLLWLRVAMGVSLQEVERETRALEFYNLISQFHFVNSTQRCLMPEPCTRSCLPAF